MGHFIQHTLMLAVIWGGGLMFRLQIIFTQAHKHVKEEEEEYEGGGGSVRVSAAFGK